VGCSFFLGTHLSGCQTKNLSIGSTVKTSQPVVISELEFSEIDGKGVDLGKLPILITIEPSEVRLLKVIATEYQDEMIIIETTAPYEQVSHLDLVTEKSNVNPMSPVLINQMINSTNRLILEAMKSIHNGELETAQKHADSLAESYPGLSAPIILRAMVAHRRGESIKAKTLYQQAALIDPVNPVIQQGLAR
jgi:hypothetical protein